MYKGRQLFTIFRFFFLWGCIQTELSLACLSSFILQVNTQGNDVIDPRIVIFIRIMN